MDSKAIEHYEKFLELWKDADPGIAELEESLVMLYGFGYPSFLRFFKHPLPSFNLT